jgi:hypothetical protein
VLDLALGMVLVVTLLAVIAAGNARAADCYAPLAAEDRWACSVELSTGQVIDYCLEATGETGSGAERTFGMVTTGPYPRVCTCGAQGEGAKARYNAASSYLCFDESTDTAEFGKIAGRKLTGQIYNVSINVRGRFSCKPDPACAVLP